jgi:hypothetical protein
MWSVTTAVEARSARLWPNVPPSLRRLVDQAAADFAVSRTEFHIRALESYLRICGYDVPERKMLP